MSTPSFYLYLKMKQNTREYLFVGIDDLSRELYVGIYSTNLNLAQRSFYKVMC